MSDVLKSNACGESWKADYGNLPCDKPKGHSDQHRTYGSQGPILWQDIKVCNRRHKWASEAGKAYRRECVKCGRVEVLTRVPLSAPNRQGDAENG